MKTFDEFSKVFDSHIRLKMLVALMLRDMSYKELKELTQCRDGGVTAHTRKLEDAGLVTVKKEFVNRRPRTTYCISKLGREELVSYMESLEEMAKEVYAAEAIRAKSDENK